MDELQGLNEEMYWGGRVIVVPILIKLQGSTEGFFKIDLF
jgi:hypothetical protein